MKSRYLVVVVLVGLTVTLVHSHVARAQGGGAMSRLLQRVDTDKDGFLTKKELEDSGRRGLVRVFERMDANGDGRLSADELPEMSQRPRPAPYQRPSGSLMLFLRLRSLDTNDDGIIAHDEIKNAQPILMSTQVSKADKNGDMTITAKEFKAFAEEIRAEPKRDGAVVNPLVELVCADANADGKLSKEEVAAVESNAAKQVAKNADTDKDGALSLAEVRAVAGPAGRWAKARERWGAGAPGLGSLSDRIKQADADDDGRVSLEELSKTMRVGADGFFSRVDKNGDGFITNDEVEQLASQRLQAAPERQSRLLELSNKLKEVDKNGDGKITAEEISAASASLPPELMKQLDLDEDGEITKEEIGKVIARGRDGGGRRGRGAFVERWSRADTNGDGAITRDEAGGSAMRIPDALFDRMDGDSDGKVSRDELESFIGTRRKAVPEQDAQ